MVFFKNANITIYNKYYSKKDEIYKYQRTVVKGVNWQGKRNYSVTDKGLLSADSVLIFISKDLKYIKPKAFERLSDEERRNYYTFQAGDKIVKGEIDFEITGVKPNNIEYLENSYDDVINVISVSDWNFHIEVGGK